jgi:hypothetical protein
MAEEWIYNLFISYVEADEEWVKGLLMPALGVPDERIINPSC